MSKEKVISNQKVIIDSWSLTPKKCLIAKEKYGLIFALQSHKDIFDRKIKVIEEGKEFLPEYYELAEQIKGINLDDFRNGNVIQKDYGFKDQRNEPFINYIKKEGKWIKEFG